MSRALYHLSYGTSAAESGRILPRGRGACLQLSLLQPSLGERDPLSLVQDASKSRGAENPRLRSRDQISGAVGFFRRPFAIVFKATRRPAARPQPSDIARVSPFPRPTAIQLVGQATPKSREPAGPGGFGVAATDQDAPFQDSARVKYSNEELAS